MAVQRGYEVELASVLARVPAFRRWENRSVPSELMRQLGELDEQTLMSLTALALHRLMVNSAPGEGPGPAIAGSVGRSDDDRVSSVEVGAGRLER